VPAAAEPPGPALGDGASLVTTGIIDADPIPELMQPSGEIR
jgi:hypothetical protein